MIITIQVLHIFLFRTIDFEILRFVFLAYISYFSFPSTNRHQFADLYLLRAFFFALAALDAGACAFGFLEEPSVDEPRSRHIIIDDAVVVEFEDPGNVHALRAGQAVTAFRAGDSGAFQELRAHALDKFHVFRRKRQALSVSAACRFSSSCCMLFMPLKQKRNPRLVPYPLQRPLRR